VHTHTEYPLKIYICVYFYVSNVIQDGVLIRMCKTMLQTYYKIGEDNFSSFLQAFSR